MELQWMIRPGAELDYRTWPRSRQAWGEAWVRPSEGQGGAEEWRDPEDSRQRLLAWGLQKWSCVKEAIWRAGEAGKNGGDLGQRPLHKATAPDSYSGQPKPFCGHCYSCGLLYRFPVATVKMTSNLVAYNNRNIIFHSCEGRKPQIQVLAGAHSPWREYWSIRSLCLPVSGSCRIAWLVTVLSLSALSSPPLLCVCLSTPSDSLL